MSKKTKILYRIATVLTFILGGGSILLWAASIPSIPGDFPGDPRGLLLSISLCGSLMSYGAVWPFTTETFSFTDLMAGIAILAMSVLIVAAAVVAFIRNFRSPTAARCKWIAVLAVVDAMIYLIIVMIRPPEWLVLMAILCLVFRAMVIAAEVLLMRSLREDELAAR